MPDGWVCATTSEVTVIADRIADLVEDGEAVGLLALQIVAGRGMDARATAVLPADLLLALCDAGTIAALQVEFFPVTPTVKPRRPDGWAFG